MVTLCLGMNFACSIAMKILILKLKINCTEVVKLHESLKVHSCRACPIGGLSPSPKADGQTSSPFHCCRWYSEARPIVPP